MHRLFAKAWRQWWYQGVFALVIAWLFYQAGQNIAANASYLGVRLGFDFLWAESGIIMDQAWFAQQATDPVWWLVVLAVVNTLVVSIAAIILSTQLAFILAILQSSGSYILRWLVTAYVNVFRNVPLLLWLMALYALLIRQLPGVANSYRLFGIVLNNRGLYFPAITVSWLLGGYLVLLIGSSKWRWSWFGPIILIGLLEWWFGPSVTIVSYPELGRFNVVGGMQLYPEFVALLAALVLYTTAFHVEIIRAGFQSIPGGQYEAARSLGMSHWQCYRHIIIPQALVLIIPPMISQYINMTKNSSLAVAVSYQELFTIYVGTIMMQTGRSIEIMAMVMAIYLLLSSASSWLMNRYYRHYVLHWVQQ